MVLSGVGMACSGMHLFGSRPPMFRDSLPPPHHGREGFRANEIPGHQDFKPHHSRNLKHGFEHKPEHHNGRHEGHKDWESYEDENDFEEPRHGKGHHKVERLHKALGVESLIISVLIFAASISGYKASKKMKEKKVGRLYKRAIILLALTLPLVCLRSYTHHKLRKMHKF